MAGNESFSQTIQYFRQALDTVIDVAMRGTGQAKAMEAMQGGIEINVYDQYEPKRYDRKREQGGLTDPANIETGWEKKTMTLTVESVRWDWEPVPQDGRHEGRLVAPVVESGRGYDFYSPGPRNFSKLTEQILEEEIEKLFTEQIEPAFAGWQM